MRKKAKSAGTQNEPAEAATAVVSGSIRTSENSEALKVELDFSSGRVTMHSDGTEIGSWPSDAVSINAIDSITFSFVAEGDQLIFVPDDPGAFGIVPLVEAEDEPTGKRSRRKAKKRTGDEVKLPARSKTGTKTKVKPTKKAGKPAKTPAKPAKKKSPRRTFKVSRAASKKRGTTSVAKSDATGRSTKKVSATSPEGIASAVDKGTSARKRSKSSASAEKKTSVWIRTLDTARRHDFFGLNRVQVNEELRGQVHEHTWDHRVAPKAGPGKHICTICGRIRR